MSPTKGALKMFLPTPDRKAETGRTHQRRATVPVIQRIQRYLALVMTARLRAGSS